MQPSTINSPSLKTPPIKIYLASKAASSFRTIFSLLRTYCAYTRMSFWTTVTSCFGSASTELTETKELPSKSLESTSTIAELSEKSFIQLSSKPESYLTPPVRSDSQLMKHAKLPPSERTSKSLAEAAARPRASIIVAEGRPPKQESGEVDAMKTWYKGEPGSAWNQKGDDVHEEWRARVARGRGCT
jgi:hypothetical protein